LANTLNNPILFYDTNLSSVFKTIDHLKKMFSHLTVVKDEYQYFEQIKENNFDLIVISLDVEPTDGIVVAKETLSIKEEDRPFIIMYSTKQDDFIVELAYNSGVDAFVNIHTNPTLMELLFKALLKRVKQNNVLPAVSNNWFINEEEYLVIKNNKKIELPKKEFRILMLLHNDQNKFFSKEELAINIWNDETIAKKRTIDVHIYNIRKILGKRIIQSQKGKGYRLNKSLFA
jgi:two-component system alkaline phosphatase synthesis response regulator PhoP